MNYIVYGTSTLFEKRLFESLSESYKSEARLYVKDEVDLDEVESVTKYPPFFHPKWLVIADMSSLGRKNLTRVLALINNPLITLYGRIPVKKKFNKPNEELFQMLAKSRVLSNRKDLEIINSLYPNNSFIQGEIFKRLKNIYLSDSALKYLTESIRFNMEDVDTIIQDVIEYGESTIDLTTIKKIVPPSQSRSLKHYVYTVLLAHRVDLKEHWKDKDKKILVSNAGTKDKPFSILNSVDLEPKDSLNIILSILKDMLRLKEVYQQGTYTLTTIFTEKKELEGIYPIMRKLKIPTISDYTKVFSEVTKDDLLFVLTSYLSLKSKPVLIEEDLYLMTVRMMRRHEEGDTK